MTIMQIKLIDLFNDSGLTATDLCRLAGVSHSTWNRLKSGHTISRPFLIRIIRTLNKASETSYSLDEIEFEHEDGK